MLQHRLEKQRAKRQAILVTVARLLTQLLLLMVIPMIVGTYVYQDSKKRGMNALLWTLVARLVPALIGFVIYLLARVEYSDERCPRCETTVRERYVVYLVSGDIRGSMNTMHLDVEQYVSEMENERIEERIQQCEKSAAQESELAAYVLHHDFQYNGGSQFLVYLPQGDDNLRIEARRTAFLLGKVLQVHFLKGSALEESGGYRLCTVSCSMDWIAQIQTYHNATRSGAR